MEQRSLLSLLLSLLLFQTASEATSLEVSKRHHPKFVCVSVCMCVCLSIYLSVFYLLLEHWRNRNETSSGRRHQPLDGYYISKTYCYYANFKVICEKPVPRLILVVHIHTSFHKKHRDLFPTFSFTSYLSPTSLSTGIDNLHCNYVLTLT